jgi:metal-dependent amidase/aminoacylase/carboxypeptidase family protein
MRCVDMMVKDFSFYSQVILSGFCYVGVRNETMGSVHTGHLLYSMIDEDMLPIGAVVLDLVVVMSFSSSPDLVE